MVHTKATRIAVLSLIAALFILAFILIKDIIIAIFFGILLAYILSPIYKKINKYVKQKDVATILLIIFITFVIAIPLWFMAPVIVKQTFETYTYLQQFNFASAIDQVFGGSVSPEFLNTISVNLDNLISKLFTSFLNSFSDFVVNFPNLLLQAAVIIFTFYFTIRDSEKLKAYVLGLSPFSAQTETKMMTEFRNITNAVIYGQFLIGVIQGLSLGLGLWILGVPKVLLLTVVSCIVCIIPVLGSGFVWGPIALVMFATGNVFGATALFLYGFLFVSLIDNILRPIILSKNTSLSVILSIIGTIGGLYTFGILGLVLGPLILAYVMIFIEFYKEGKLNELFKDKG